MKAVMMQRDEAIKMQEWQEIKEWGKFSMGKMYRILQTYGSKVEWRNLQYNNNAKPRSKFMFWMACHERLATKDRLCKFGFVKDTKCGFCVKDESVNHLFFECESLKKVWKEVLAWIQINHSPGDWNDERNWLVQNTKGKGSCAAIIKMAATETIYALWKYRNARILGDDIDIDKVRKDIIDTLVYKGWENKKLRNHIAILMLED
ncbi:uncharacterized protein LOC131635498 [Vicia villosa]|uniref:uncharacterized protein LOC131635498 n=1 Tax=Vicia villosa TaxID=3911 RepID=UPI00273AFB7E|nr:uncharacterized protein LOC131635498 [Vicia villosa]